MWERRSSPASAHPLRAQHKRFFLVTGALHKPAGAFPALGYWFIVLAAVTWMGMWAACAENKMVAVVLWFLAAGSTSAAVGELLASPTAQVIAGYFFIVSAIIAWYTASAIMLEAAFHHSVIGDGKTARAKSEAKITPGAGEPGIIRGQ